MTRVYIAGTLPLLAQWADQESVQVIGQAHAVTPALKDYFTEADQDELEYAAMVEAAMSSLHLLAQDPEALPRRVVAAADVPLSLAPSGDEYPLSAVLLPGPVPMSQIVSFHIDEGEAQDDVRTAVAAVPAADSGDEAAQLLVEQVEVHDLLWFDVTELDQLVGRAESEPG